VRNEGDQIGLLLLLSFNTYLLIHVLVKTMKQP